MRRFPVISLLLMMITVSGVLTSELRGELMLWSEPRDISETSTDETNWYPVALCDQYQNLHLLWINYHEEMGSSIHYRTNARGTWSPTNSVLAMSGMIADLSAVIRDQDDSLHVIWRRH